MKLIPLFKAALILASAAAYAQQSVFEFRTRWDYMGNVRTGSVTTTAQTLCGNSTNSELTYIQVELVADRPGWELSMGRPDQVKDFQFESSNASMPTNLAGTADNNIVILPPGFCIPVFLHYTAQKEGRSEANIRLNRLDCVDTGEQCSENFLVRVEVADAITQSEKKVWRGEISLSKPADKVFFNSDGQLRVIAENEILDYRLATNSIDFLPTNGYILSNLTGTNPVCNTGEYLLEYLPDSDSVRVRDQQGRVLSDTNVPDCDSGLLENGCSAPGDSFFLVCENHLSSASIQPLNGSLQFQGIDNYQGIDNAAAWYSPDPNTLILVNHTMIAMFGLTPEAVNLIKTLPVEHGNNPLITGNSDANNIYTAALDSKYINRFDFSQNAENTIVRLGHDRLENINGISLSQEGVLVVLHDNGKKLSVFADAGATRNNANSALLFLMVFTLNLITK